VRVAQQTILMDGRPPDARLDLRCHEFKINVAALTMGTIEWRNSKIVTALDGKKELPPRKSVGETYKPDAVSEFASSR
jgi:hypothetical protein